jgi:hypothetical protein
MSETADMALVVSQEERALLNELLSAERDRLLVEIRHTNHRIYRDQLRQRLEIVQGLLSREPSSS